MAEEEQGGGKGSIKLPGIGPANKKVVMVVGGAGAAYVLWRYWQARKASATTDTTAQDPGMTDAGTLPSVSGAVSPTNSYGLPSDSTGATGTDAFGFHGTTNDEWTQYAAAQLSQSERWSYTDIVTALGKYLAGRPLSGTEVDIVQAAIAVAGYPPVGQHPIVSGGNVPVLVAPTGLAGSALSDTSVALHWNSVAGASGYQVYRGGGAGQTVTGTSATVTGLAASTAYGFQVAALSAGGNPGPLSSAVTVTTKAAPTSSTPPPKTGGGGGSKPPSGSRHRTWTISSQYPSLSQLVEGYNRTYHTNFTWEEIWSYNLAHRDPSTVKVLKSRGPNFTYHGSTFWFPY